jgi:hypothetical protein
LSAGTLTGPMVSFSMRKLLIAVDYLCLKTGSENKE